MKGYSSSTEFVQHTGFITRGIHIPLIGIYLIYNVIKNYEENQQIKIDLLEQRNKSTQRIIESVDAERQRIAMALHDAAGSIITGIKANLQMISPQKEVSHDEYFKTSVALTDQLREEIRDISYELLPSSVVKLGLVAEIEQILTRIEAAYDIQTNFEHNDPLDNSIDQKLLFHLYYIIREALDNVVKYAEAPNILVQFFQYEDEIHLLIEDDGIGFDLDKMLVKGGNGLQNLKLRVSWMNGSIDILSHSGTSISINIPLAPS